MDVAYRPKSVELRALAERILFATSLEEKLVGTDHVTDENPGPGLAAPPAQPGRPATLRFKPAGAESAAFPGLHQLESAPERGRLLHFFCNHELLATELMALVLLRFPDAPPAFRRGVWQTLRDEQAHTRLYLERMQACGQTFGELPVSGYFWRSVASMSSPLDFVAGLSLTFEQANLDFARHYASALKTVGDVESGAVLEGIYRDEIAHVAHGLKWFRRWKNPQLTDWAAYCGQLTFPLSPSRAKGPWLNREGRQAAGLDDAFIAALEVHSQSKGRTPTVFWFNPLAEGWLAHGPGFTPGATQAALVADLAGLPQFLARTDDVVLVPRRPRVEFLSELKQAGFPIPEFVEWPTDHPPAANPLAGRRLGGLRPWAWGPDSLERLAPLAGQLPAGGQAGRRGEGLPEFTPAWRQLYSKLWSADWFKRVWSELPGRPWLCPESAIGVPATSWSEIEAAIATIRSGGHHRVVVKAAFGLAGQSALRLWEPELLPAQRRWLEAAVTDGRSAVVEPWLERVFDFSAQFEMEPGGLQLRGFTGLLTDPRGQFQANWVGEDHGRRPPKPVVHALLAAGAPPGWVTHLFAELRVRLERELRAVNFLGPLGIDAFLYRSTTGDVRLKPVVELNPRHTMGRLLLELTARLGPGVPAEFRIVNRSQLRSAGQISFVSYAHGLKERWPVTRSGHPTARLTGGVVPLNDPTTATTALAVLRVGLASAAPADAIT